MKLLFYSFILLFTIQTVMSQNSSITKEFPDSTADLYYPNINDGTIWQNNSHINKGRLTTIFGSILVADLFGLYHLKDTWYSSEREKFHAQNFEHDMKKWQQMDKIGHAAHAFIASDLFTKSFRWAGLSAKESIWYGTLTGWLWILQIEITDGFFKDWGFSWGDLIGNTVGSGFSAARQFYPDELQGIVFKYSYHTSTAYKQGKYIRKNISFVDDYEGFTIWLAFNVYDMLPTGWQKSYPEWLKPFGLAIGQSARGIAGTS